MITAVSQKERITGNKLKNQCCEQVFEPGNTLPIQPAGCFIIFCKTEHVLSFFNECKINYNTQYILLTHNSDFPITKDIFEMAPPNVYKWFAMNVKHKHEKLESVPIGSVGSTWIGVDAYADQKHLHDFVLIEEDEKPKNHRNLVYVNFGIHTNTSHRKPIYDHFKDKEWCTVRTCDAPELDYDKADGFVSISEYYDEVYNHKFIMSPLGNGVDCGRNWQSIYVGSIPIVPRHINIEFYDELPILVYDDINDLTEEYLNKVYKEMSSKNYNLEKATLSYWKNRFLEEKNKALGIKKE